MALVYKLAKEKIKTDSKQTIEQGIVELESILSDNLDKDEILYYIALGYQKLGNTRAFHTTLAQIKSFDERVQKLYNVSSSCALKSNTLGRTIAVSFLILLGALASGRSK